ncbi:tRNA threonylcarbamoyladenosine dehydratase [bacterium]|nr:tRNA threonylcarbamoyladenosine dehydratase [bacterium]
MSERFRRMEMMIGAEGLARLHAARVTVIGLGAVGSYATEGLARAGIGHLRLVDHDFVRESNINRQLYALTSTLGRPKIEVAAERVRDINPDCQVDTVRTFVHVETMDEVFAGEPNVIVDAIDAYTPKLELICAAIERGVPLISSMGAALRADTTRIRVGPLGQTTGCPLARQLRQGLRRRGVEPSVRCVYSDEPVDTRRVFPPEELAAGELERGRRRRALGSLPTVTGIFGLTLANEAIRLLAGLP